MRTRLIKLFFVIFSAVTAISTGALSPIQIDADQTSPYRILNEPSTHTAGKVRMEIFVDFYCPHCHHFESMVLPELKREFGDKLEVSNVGFPVIRNKPSMPFELYEAARGEGRGDIMAGVLFRVLQDERLNILDPSVEDKVIQEAGMNPEVMKNQIASGEPKRKLEEGVSRANRYGVHSTPTVLLDGYVLSDVPTAENLRPLVQKLLAGERL
jgi:thiol:disulfide interchange protein DsbA